MSRLHEPAWKRLIEPETPGERLCSGAWRALSAPLWLLYLSTMKTRRWAYRRRLLPSAPLPRPTLSVGNLLAGGTGKTPLVRWLCRELLREGVRPAVLLRGYGSGRRLPLLLNSGQASSVPDPDRNPCGAGGDEAWLLAASLPQVPIGVCPDRRRGAEALLGACDADLFILDDAFQHQRVERQLNVVVVDVGRSHAVARLIPWGTLREPLSALADAHVICATHAPAGQALPRPLRELAARLGLEVARAEHRPTRPTRLSDGAALTLSAEAVRWFLLAGVGNPSAVERSLKEAGFRLEHSFFFPDHHEFTWKELERVYRVDPGAHWLTTAKDAVRMHPMLEARHELARFLAERVFVVDVELELVEGAELLRQRALTLVG